MVAAALWIEAESSHLIFYFTQDLLGRGWSFWPEILHVLELLGQVFLNCLNEQVQVRDVIALGRLLATAKRLGHTHIKSF